MTAPYGLYVSAEGAAAQSLRMEVLSNNLANVDTPGFKRQLAILQARHSEAIEQGLNGTGSGTLNDIGGGVEVAETLTEYGQGTLRKTGNTTDMAIQGEGFFMVSGEDNERLLTRAGNFIVTSDGRLTTQDGSAVLSQDFSPIQLSPNVPWDVSDEGFIRQGGQQIPLALVKPNFPADLVHQGESTFRAIADPTPVAPNERNVRSGYLELSGVKPTTAMMEMIEASRAFESNVKVIQHQDEMIGQLLSRVLRQQ